MWVQRSGSGAKSHSIATTNVRTAGSSIETYALATSSACSTPSKSSSSSVGAAAVIAVGCTIVAAVFAAALVESDGGDLAARIKSTANGGFGST